MDKRLELDQEYLNGLSFPVALWDDDRDFIVETLGGLSGNLLKRLQGAVVDKERCVQCHLTLSELRKIINELFTIALYNEDVEEDANRIGERLLICEYEIQEAMEKEMGKYEEI